MDKSFLSPVEIAESVIEIGCKKVNTPLAKQFVLGILAGAFIAFASQGSNVAIHTISSVGIAKTLAGALFATGLMMVVIAGGELFTGNSLIIVSCVEGKTKLSGMLLNWLLVYLGNFVGAAMIAVFILQSGQLDLTGGLLGGLTIKTAASKTGLTFGRALLMGVLCNWIVCVAVWMSYSARDISGKILAMFFPIWLFVVSGFEHSVANMYAIPAGIMAKANPLFVEQALGLGATQKSIDALGWGSFITANLLPVTIGNIIGGAGCVGLAYWYIYIRGMKKDRSA